MLEILFAEQRDIGPHLVEQLGDDCRNAIEMARPRRAVESVADARHRNIGGKTVRVHFLGRWQPQDRAARVGQHPRILQFAPGVAREVFGRAELLRIDEDRGDDLVRDMLGRFDQRDVAGVQRAHRRHQRHPQILRTNARDFFPELVDLTDGLHAR